MLLSILSTTIYFIRLFLLSICFLLLACFDFLQLFVVLPFCRRLVRRTCRAPCSRIILLVAGISPTNTIVPKDFEHYEELIAEAYDNNTTTTTKLPRRPPNTQNSNNITKCSIILSTLSANIFEILYLDWLFSPDYAFPGLRKDTVVVCRSLISALDVACSKVPSVGGAIFAIPVINAVHSASLYCYSPLVLFGEGACNDGISILQFSPAARTALVQNDVQVHLVGFTSGGSGAGSGELSSATTTAFINKSDTFFSYLGRILLTHYRIYLTCRILTHQDRLQRLHDDVAVPSTSITTTSEKDEEEKNNDIERTRTLLCKLAGCNKSKLKAFDVLQ
jgi:hypothetical protein